MITTTIKEGQQFVEDPIYLLPKRPSLVEISVAEAFGKYQIKPRLLQGHERVKLRWVNPDGTPKVFAR